MFFQQICRLKNPFWGLQLRFVLILELLWQVIMTLAPLHKDFSISSPLNWMLGNHLVTPSPAFHLPVLININLVKFYQYTNANAAIWLAELAVAVSCQWTGNILRFSEHFSECFMQMANLTPEKTERRTSTVFEFKNVKLFKSWVCVNNCKFPITKFCQSILLKCKITKYIEK